MRSFPLAAALTVGLSGAVLAAPGAPGVLPVAPPPRAKFAAPEFNNTFEVIVYTSARPVRVRVEALHEGKSVGEVWGDRMRKHFDFCDRDGDGSLSQKEAKYAFSDQGLAQLMSNGFFQAVNSSPDRFADRDGDGRVSFDEFLASYDRTAKELLRRQPIQQDFGNNAAVTEAIFKMVDADKDGKLTRDEVKSVEKLLNTRDTDEDECLSMAELTPEMYDQFGNYRGQIPQPLRPPNGNPAPAAAGNQPVMIYEANLVPGTVTQQVITKYDKDGDFELTQAEVGFDDFTFQSLDANKDGKLGGEELDAWRTGAPDVDLTLSLAPMAAECVAKLKDEKAAAARGFRMKRVEGGRLMLHVGRQPIDFWSAAQLPQARQAALKQQYGYLFTQAAKGKGHVVEKDLEGPDAVQFQFVRVMFDSADRDADGKMTKAEFDAYFDLQEGFRNLSISLSPAVQTPSLFQLLDENRDGRLSVRELRTAWVRLQALEESGAEVVTRNVIQPAVVLRLSRTFDRNFIQVNQGGGRNPNQVAVPTKGPLWFRKMDRNADGDVSRIEYLGAKEEFNKLDADGDGLISFEEAEAWDKAVRKGEK